MKMTKTIAIAVAVAAFASFAMPSAGYAAGTGGCESFAWPLKTELDWMKATDSEAAQSGATFTAPPAKAIAVTLQPADAVTFDVAPTGKGKAESGKAFGGIITFDGVAEPGLYQVSLSGPGWIDVVQGGKALETEAHTGKSDCEGLRKSVRFKIGAGPFVVQLNGVPEASIKLAIRRAE